MAYALVNLQLVSSPHLFLLSPIVMYGEDELGQSLDTVVLDFPYLIPDPLE